MKESYKALFLLSLCSPLLAQKDAPVDTDYVSADLLQGPSAIDKHEVRKATLKVGTFGMMSVAQDLITGQLLELQGKIAPSAVKATEPTTKTNIQSNIEALGAPKVGTDLKLISSSSTVTGTHSVYQQLFNGYPVFGGGLTVNTPTDSKGAGTIHNNLKIINQPVEASNFVDSAQAISAALSAVRFKLGPTAAPTADAGILAVDGTPVPVWRVRYRSQDPGATWEVMVRSSDSKVLSVRNAAVYRFASSFKQIAFVQHDSLSPTAPSPIPPPRALVFIPNPIQSSGNANFPEHMAGGVAESDFPQIANARAGVALSHLAAGGHLDGTFASTALSTHFTRADQQDTIFEFARSDQRFDEVMAYYWVTQSTLYAQSLGYPGINNRQLQLDVNGWSADNSGYSDGVLTFGSGGIRDAEDAEVILHETGHAIQDSQVPGLLDNGGHDIHAMSEGFSDYWAASFFADIGPTTWNVFFDKWDGQVEHPAANGFPPYLRRLDSTKHYPEGIVGEIHADGEIWSACLWKIRGILGRTMADKLFLESNYSLSPDTTFADAAGIIVATFPKMGPKTPTSQQQLQSITQVFIDRGILSR